MVGAVFNAGQFDPTSIRQEIVDMPFIQDARETHEGSVHGSVSKIWVRAPREQTMEAYNDGDSVDIEGFPMTRLLVKNLMDRLGYTGLGRVIIVRLQKGDSIPKHADAGDYPQRYDRYHAVIYGAFLWMSDKGYLMEAGNVYGVNPLADHAVYAVEDRISIIIDLENGDDNV